MLTKFCHFLLSLAGMLPDAMESKKFRHLHKPVVQHSNLLLPDEMRADYYDY